MYTVLRRTKPEYWSSELRAATGRSAIYHLLTYVAVPSVVLMPSYVPEGVIGPIKKAGVRIYFYRLNPDLTPNLEDIEDFMTPEAMVIVIHYFGYLTDCSEIRKIVDEKDGILFEDCAHTLYDEASKANFADVALWSLNKFMPVTDGALLRSRNRKINVHPIYALQIPHSDIMRLYREHLDLTAAMVNSDNIGLLDGSTTAYEEYYKRINTDYRPYQQSIESKLIESQFDIEQESRIRTINAWRMNMLLPGLRAGMNLPQFAFPLMLKSAEHRKEVSNKLLKLGILASRQVDKWNHVPNAEFTAELDFMERHLLLPLGDNMDKELIGQISDAI